MERLMFTRCLFACVLFVGACAPAFAQSGSLNIGAVVMPTRQAVHVQSDFPVPARGMQLTTHRFGGSWLVRDALPATTAFYRDAMRQRGYRVLSERIDDDFVQLRLERNGEHVELRLQPVLGNTPATRMILRADAG